MAQIIYFPNPLDETKVHTITSKGTLYYALKELGIEKEQLCVAINGMVPEEIDPSTYVLDDTDFVEIRREVHGGGNAENKSTLATIVQIAGLVAASFFPPAAAYILIGTSVAAGALNKWAMDLRAAAARGTQTENDIDVASNNYSLNSASNEARPLRPIPIVMGSHRFAPDIHTDAFRNRYGSGYIVTRAAPYATTFYPGIIPSNGPEAPDNSWAVMQPNAAATNLPRYRMKIMPYGFTTKTTALTTAENAEIINKVVSGYVAPTLSAWTRTLVSPFPLNKSYSLVVYHDDPLDPYYGRFNTWFGIARQVEQFPANYAILSNLFAGTNPGGLGTQYYFTTQTTNEFLMWAYDDSFPYYMPIGFNPGENNAIMYGRYGAFLLAMNNGSYSASAKTASYPAQMYLSDYSLTQVAEGVPFSTQLFNFGFGEMDITERKVGTTNITPDSVNTIQASSIDKTNLIPSERWAIPALNIPLRPKPDWGAPAFPIEVLNHEPKALINPDTVEIGIIPPNDLKPYNFVYFGGQRKMDSIHFGITGSIYQTGSTGITANTARLQLQWKWSSDPIWTDYTYPIITVSNNTTKQIYLSYELNSMLTNPTPDRLENQYLEVRIRKVTLDQNDHTGNKICQLSISDITFYKSIDMAIAQGWNKQNAPFNIDGLMVTALVTDTSTTNKYSALVESKCFVYDFDTDTWSWAKTRNPAWWFLFFAKGGFYNFESMADLTYPYSPTYGWQNYPGHPNNTEQMFGGGYMLEELDMDKILEWGYFCDENDLVMDMIFKDEMNVSDVLEKIANLGRASVSYYGGKLSIVIEDPEQVPVCLFGMGNIIAGSFRVDYSVGDIPAKVIGKYVNRDSWETEQVEADVPFSDPENIKTFEINLDGITDTDLAQREVNILAARQYYQRRTYSWQTDVEGYLARRGDLISLAHDSTQYGYSGRIMDFVIESGVVTGIKTSAFVDESVSWIMIRYPNGTLETYECHFVNGVLVFDEPYAIEDASFYYNVNEENSSSDFANSHPEDFVFIADIKSTPGKRVRISQIEGSDDGTFTITAVDEDPAMWAYEFNDVIPSESFDDTVQVVEILDLKWVDMKDGKLRLMWNMTGDFAQVINLNTGLPLEANGQYSFSNGDVVFELEAGGRYSLEVQPLVIGEAFRSKSQKVDVWLL